MFKERKGETDMDVAREKEMEVTIDVSNGLPRC